MGNLLGFINMLILWRRIIAPGEDFVGMTIYVAELFTLSALNGLKSRPKCTQLTSTR